VQEGMSPPPEWLERIGHRVQVLRRRQRLSRATLARRARLGDRRRITWLELGYSSPVSVPELWRVADVLGVPITDLVIEPGRSPLDKA
jgi:transcriptional regulator with XRE-family HTH domain